MQAAAAGLDQKLQKGYFRLALSFLFDNDDLMSDVWSFYYMQVKFITKVCIYNDMNEKVFVVIGLWRPISYQRLGPTCCYRLHKTIMLT